MNWATGSHMGFMGFWWIFILAALVVLVWGIAAAGRGRRKGDSSAEQRLKERYAAGEIDQEAYERMLANIRK